MTIFNEWRRSHETPEGRRFGASLAAAGVAATAYHAVPKGRARSGLRKLDHWTISLATNSMLHAICPDMSRVGFRSTMPIA